MFKDLFHYKPNAEDIFSRMDKLYADAQNRKGGNVLFRVLLDSDVDIYSKLEINKYDYDKDIDLYSMDLCRGLEQSFEARIDLLDDAVPAITPVLGIGDYSAFVTGDITFSKDTSWSSPSIKEDIYAFKNFEPLGTAPWYKRFLAICEALLKRSKGSGIPFSRGFFSPLDLAEAFRGENIYLDFYDDPDGVHELLSFCADATIKFAEDIYALAGKYLKDSRYGMWFLEGTINMSEDIACMISPELYREFAAPHTQRVINHFGKGFMHSHSRALYQVKEICRLDNVVNLWLATDPNQPRPIDNLASLIKDADGVCLAIDCNDISEIEANMDTALTGNVSFCLPVKSKEEANGTIERFNKLVNRG